MSCRARVVGAVIVGVVGVLASLPGAVADEVPPPDLDAAVAAYQAALTAREGGDDAAYRAGLERAAVLLPDPARLLYRLAAARLAAGDHAGAIAALAQQVEAGLDRDPRDDPAFAALGDDPEYLALLARLDALSTPIVASRERFRLEERDALFEGVAIDPRDGAVYLSSVRRCKVVRRAADGTVDDVVPSRAHDLGAALGLAIDAERRLLWIVTAGLPQALGLDDAARLRTGLVAVDLDTGASRRRIEGMPGAAWNDLALARDGTVFVSAPGSASIERAAPDGTVSELARGHGMRSPGGLALSADERTLYVADWSVGLAAIDVASGAFAWLRAPEGATLLGIDGLCRAGDALIAIQNGVSPACIRRLALADDGRAIRAATVLERAVPGWDEPTLGAVIDGTLVYLASSHWPAFAADGAAPDPATLDMPTVRALPLP